jgi:hypothetical protein
MVILLTRHCGAIIADIVEVKIGAAAGVSFEVKQELPRLRPEYWREKYR